MYECIIFDVDGTLIDTRHATILALKKVLEEETENSFTDDELKHAIGIPGEKSLPGFGVKDIHAANLKWNTYLKDFSAFITVYPGIEDTILRLFHSGVTMGIVTSNTKYELEGLLGYFLPFRLMDYLSFAVCADDTKRHKPYADPILKYLQLSGASPSKTIYIGDTVYDMKCAGAANIDFGLALWGAAHPDEINAKHIFSSPGDILKVAQRSLLQHNTARKG